MRGLRGIATHISRRLILRYRVAMSGAVITREFCTSALEDLPLDSWHGNIFVKHVEPKGKLCSAVIFDSKRLYQMPEYIPPTPGISKSCRALEADGTPMRSALGLELSPGHAVNLSSLLLSHGPTLLVFWLSRIFPARNLITGCMCFSPEASAYESISSFVMACKHQILAVARRVLFRPIK